MKGRVSENAILAQREIFGETGNSCQEKPEVYQIAALTEMKLLFAAAGQHVLLHVAAQSFEIRAAILAVVLRDAFIR
jgi:hypothetical protein